MAHLISASVGRGGINLRPDVLTIQKLLNNARPGLSRRIAEDGAVGPETIAAVEEFQRRVVGLHRPDGRVDPAGKTLQALRANQASSAAPLVPSLSNNQQFFPFSSLPRESWTTGPRAFGSNRSGGTRAHAGCDLYFPKGTWIHAIADGKVVQGPYGFYCETFALEVDHGGFLARYGEIQSETPVKAGDQVKAGQNIAKVGHLVGIAVPSDMLHLELYSKGASGPLSVHEASRSKRRADGIPFYRRMDLLDPTGYLNQWKTNLPPAS
jgi:murein DD-endopeptidase MepM/ murein hydrolase activator NlpD